MMKLSPYLFFILNLCLSVNAVATKNNCFREHLKEAIELNLYRKPLYSKITNGYSEHITDKLIQMERSVVFISHFSPWDFDRKFGEFSKYGIHAMCDSFISMKTVTEFNRIFKNGPPSDSTSLVTSRPIQNLLQPYLDKNDVTGVFEQLKKTLIKFDQEPRLNCMTKHTLESMARIANLYSVWVQKISINDDKNKLLSLVVLLLKNHLKAIPQTATLDRLVRPLNLSGYPMICQDVPHISYENIGEKQ